MIYKPHIKSHFPRLSFTHLVKLEMKETSLSPLPSILNASLVSVRSTFKIYLPKSVSFQSTVTALVQAIGAICLLNCLKHILTDSPHSCACTLNHSLLDSLSNHVKCKYHDVVALVNNFGIY